MKKCLVCMINTDQLLDMTEVSSSHEQAVKRWPHCSGMKLTVGAWLGLVYIVSAVCLLGGG